MKFINRHILGKLTFRLALAYLLFIFVLGWGIAIGRYEVFPFDYLKGPYNEIVAFVKGGPKGKANISQKIAHELNIIPGRFMVELGTHNKLLKPVSGKIDIFSKRRELPVFHSKGVRNGFYVIQGIFDFRESMSGLLAINAMNGQITRYWIIPRGRKNNSYPQGMELYSDGTIYSSAPNIDAPTNKSVGDLHGIVGLNWCGEQLLTIPPKKGDIHHSVNKNGEGFLWTWDGYDFVKFNKNNGKETARFSIFDVIAANSEIHAFEIRMKGLYRNLKSLSAKDFLSDPFHPNDIDPLPKDLSHSFPEFETGDLLVSLRNLNLIFVLRPNTRKVIWYSQGQVSRQHDPEWNSDGTISVYNNKPYLENSDITKIDLQNNSVKTLVSGKKYSIFGRARGDHTVLSDGSILIVATEQGRMLHVSNDGKELEAEFVNKFDERNGLRIFNAEYVSAIEYEQFENSCK
jgi:hypothetical protein